MNPIRTPSIEAFSQELMGKRCPVAFLEGKGKGALGMWVEDEMRRTIEGQRCHWVGRGDSKADCQGLEIKIVIRQRRKRPSPFCYRIKEDLAIGMIHPSIFQTSYLDSKLYQKLNLLLVVLELVEDFYIIQQFKHINLQAYEPIEHDFNQAKAFYSSACQTIEPQWVIDALGYQSPGYGLVLKSKTKGHRLALGQARRRAFYLRKNFVEKLLVDFLD